MSVRVVARIRPLLPKEIARDIIVQAASSEEGQPYNVVKIPSPKNESEIFSFTFNSVYDQETTQEELFNQEVAPHIKSLFQGLDITIFAYGVTGTGKTHTMRGGMKLADRGVIPRILSHVFRRGKKIAKDSDGLVDVDVALSYYEIYNDKVFDLLEPPEKRTATGLPLREKDNKTYVVGLSERRCEDLRDFERLYIAANQNRVTASTKLNAHSSRSHAILRVKLTQTTHSEDGSGSIVSIRESTASAIDLAGSEDNRRTENGRERLVESAAINKSLFVLSQCVDAIARGERRIPYRESKMTRILSLGQNNGITVMILNLSPLRSYHLDTLSSLNVSSRAKRIEVREIENEVVYKQVPRMLTSTSSSSSAYTSTLSSSSAVVTKPATSNYSSNNANPPPSSSSSLSSSSNNNSSNSGIGIARSASTTTPGTITSSLASARMGPLAARPRPSLATTKIGAVHSRRLTEPAEARPSKMVPPSVHAYSASNISLPRPSTTLTSTTTTSTTSMAATTNSQLMLLSAEQIEAIVERKVAEALAARAEEEDRKMEEQRQKLARLEALELAAGHDNTVSFGDLARSNTGDQLSEAVQKRLEALERRIDDTTSSRGSEDPRSEGLRYLLLARQNKEVGDDAAALRYYELALPFFPGQAKLLSKIEKLKAKLGISSGGTLSLKKRPSASPVSAGSSPRKQLQHQQLAVQKRKRVGGSSASTLTPLTPTFRRAMSAGALSAFSGDEDEVDYVDEIEASGSVGDESNADTEDDMDDEDAHFAKYASAPEKPSRRGTLGGPRQPRKTVRTLHSDDADDDEDDDDDALEDDLVQSDEQDETMSPVGSSDDTQPGDNVHHIDTLSQLRGGLSMAII